MSRHASITRSNSRSARTSVDDSSLARPSGMRQRQRKEHFPGCGYLKSAADRYSASSEPGVGRRLERRTRHSDGAAHLDIGQGHHDGRGVFRCRRVLICIHPRCRMNRGERRLHCPLLPRNDEASPLRDDRATPVLRPALPCRATLRSSSTVHGTRATLRGFSACRWLCRRNVLLPTCLLGQREPHWRVLSRAGPRIGPDLEGT